MPERNGDKVIYRVALDRRDHEALVEWCRSQKSDPAALLESLGHEAAGAAREALSRGDLSKGRAEKHSQPKEPAPVFKVVSESEARREEARAQRELDRLYRFPPPVEPVEPPAPKPAPPVAPLSKPAPVVHPRLRKAPVPAPGAKRSYVKLSGRHDEIAALNALGYTDTEIAAHVGCSIPAISAIRNKVLSLPRNSPVSDRPAPTA